MRAVSGAPGLVAALCWAACGAAAGPATGGPEEKAGWSPGEPRPGALSVPITGPGPGSGDGVYGRFNGDLNLGLALGVELGEGAARGAGRLDVRYYFTAGLYATYRDALGGESLRQRTLSCGVSLRPLFIPRWSKNLERGPAWLDLTLDSLSVGVGRYWDEPLDAAFGRERGFEAALGLAFPLLARADGPWLEGYGELRWSDAPGGRGEPAEASAFALLGWQFFADTPLARRAGR